MSVFDWRAMRNNHLLMALLASTLSALPSSAAEPNPPLEQATTPPRAANRAEYRPQSLPDDVFTPSEEVSEDYPVAFPVDI